MRHYIYLFLDPDTLKHRYYGQGQGNRWNWWKFVRKDDEAQYGIRPWLRDLKRAGKKPIVIKVRENLTQAEANRWEVYLIAMVGRADEKKGPLLNRAAGGQGSPGAKPSAETRRKLSLARMGNTNSKGRVPANKGKPHSEATRKKMSEACKGKKRKPRSEEHCRNLSKAKKGKPSPLKGKKRSEEVCQKISKARKGTPSPSKGKPSPLKGRKLGPYRKRKLAAT